jgi:hypothetical protein
MLTAEVVIAWISFLLIASMIALVALPAAKLRNGVNRRLVDVRNSVKLRRIGTSVRAVFLCLFAALVLLICVDWCVHVLLHVNAVQ